MSLQKTEIISAQVVLRSASGKAPDGSAIITAETIGEYTPAPDTVTGATTAFAAAGFEVGQMIGNSFAITAPVGTFERVFRTRLRRQPRGDVQVVHSDGSSSYELPLHMLPATMARHVVAVTLTPPPEFGPTDFGP